MNERGPHSRGHWLNKDNQLEYLSWLFEKLSMRYQTEDKVKDDRYFEQWYKVQKSDFSDNGGRGLLLIYNDSVYNLLRNLYPQYEWLPWKFKSTPKNIWKDMENQQRYMKWLGDKLNYVTSNQWYGVSKQDFIQNHGYGLLQLYNGSPVKVVLSVLGDHFKIWKFKNLPREALKDEKVLLEFMQYAREYYEIKEPREWYRVSWSQLRDIGGYSLIKKNGGIYETLKLVYPENVGVWNARMFSQPGKKSSQRLLKIYLEQLFIGVDVHEDYRDSKLKYKDLSTFPFHLDFYVPEFRLAFEYQGKQHYQDTKAFGDSEIYKKRDKEKREICNQNQIQIIEIPYWWNNDITSLIGTITQECSSPIQQLVLQNYSKNQQQQDVKNNLNSTTPSLQSFTTISYNENSKSLKFPPIPKSYQKLTTNKKKYFIN
ncbi:hypothetical protein DLAC_08803 [Tieghemostelium lacteum]|uniref:Uncharacterized protein n=1 Tax=Tieghemostelium lacteum TaxID=361077 RepID=A0A151Z8R6_TIELA|nr:hypothetical protein DLAC_08803 [Tieghemostelium lacteum]|eukprot:KYQ90204.1 hypothetical protein DLAC_08803 [Tieghemostelium lacteum]